MLYTPHALQRMNERHFSIGMIEDSITYFYKLGFWDQKGDRLTLKTNTAEFHERLTYLNNVCNRVRGFIRYLKKRIKSGERLQERLFYVKSFYKEAKLKLKNLKKLEHKQIVTLVIKNDYLITVFKKKSHFKRDVNNRQIWVRQQPSFELTV